MIDTRLIDSPLSLLEVQKVVGDPSCGGMVFFEGTVRNATKGKPVLRLEFEAYVPMAKKELRKIAEVIAERWNALHVAIHHRIGTLEIGESAVIIGVSSPHRKAAFEACQYAIDTLKETVPIWKKEIFEDGEIWVSAHP